VYRDDVPVFRASTSTPSIVIPDGKGGKSSALTPGTYKWSVWPVRDGRTDKVAVVSSTFVVPAK
jgi:hypothetical protein